MKASDVEHDQKYEMKKHGSHTSLIVLKTVRRIKTYAGREICINFFSKTYV
jgi:hypothetical protein